MAAFFQVVNQVVMSKAVDNLPIPLQHRNKKKENLNHSTMQCTMILALYRPSKCCPPLQCSLKLHHHYIKDAIMDHQRLQLDINPFKVKHHQINSRTSTANIFYRHHWTRNRHPIQRLEAQRNLKEVHCSSERFNPTVTRVLGKLKIARETWRFWSLRRWWKSSLSTKRLKMYWLRNLMLFKLNLITSNNWEVLKITWKGMILKI